MNPLCWLIILGLIWGLPACAFNHSVSKASSQAMKIKIYQKWEVQRGDFVANHSVVAGLGDLAIATNGAMIYAPIAGKTQIDQTNCLLLSGNEVPGYLFRFCGLETPNPGQLRQGQPMGKADFFVFATLRKQADGTWALVEPSKAIVERTLNPKQL